MIETEEQRSHDRIRKMIPAQGSRKSKTHGASLEVIKSAYITEGLTPEEMCDRFALSPETILALIEEHSLEALRNSYRKEGLKALQKTQIDQAQQMMELESKFKQIQLLQLQEKLEDYMAYYARHGDFKKRHPITGEVLLDSNEIPMQINVPSVVREIEQLKSSMILSEGMKKILVSIEDIIRPNASHAPKHPSQVEDDQTRLDETVIDLEKVDQFFQKRD